jgi:hypothetical protein
MPGAATSAGATAAGTKPERDLRDRELSMTVLWERAGRMERERKAARAPPSAGAAAAAAALGLGGRGRGTTGSAGARQPERKQKRKAGLPPPPPKQTLSVAQQYMLRAGFGTGVAGRSRKLHGRQTAADAGVGRPASDAVRRVGRGGGDTKMLMGVEGSAGADKRYKQVLQWNVYERERDQRAAEGTASMAATRILSRGGTAGFGTGTGSGTGTGTGAGGDAGYGRGSRSPGSTVRWSGLGADDSMHGDDSADQSMESEIAPKDHDGASDDGAGVGMGSGMGFSTGAGGGVAAACVSDARMERTSVGAAAAVGTAMGAAAISAAVRSRSAGELGLGRAHTIAGAGGSGLGGSGRGDAGGGIAAAGGEGVWGRELDGQVVDAAHGAAQRRLARPYGGEAGLPSMRQDLRSPLCATQRLSEWGKPHRHREAAEAREREATPVEEGELGPRGQHAPGSSALMGGRWEPEPQPLPLPEPVVPGVRELLLMHPMMRQTAEAKAVVALQRRAQRLKQEKAAERVERLAIDSGSGCGVSFFGGTGSAADTAFDFGNRYGGGGGGGSNPAAAATAVVTDIANKTAAAATHMRITRDGVGSLGGTLLNNWPQMKPGAPTAHWVQHSAEAATRDMTGGGQFAASLSVGGAPSATRGGPGYLTATRQRSARPPLLLTPIGPVNRATPLYVPTSDSQFVETSRLIVTDGGLRRAPAYRAPQRSKFWERIELAARGDTCAHTDLLQQIEADDDAMFDDEDEERLGEEGAMWACTLHTAHGTAGLGMKFLCGHRNAAHEPVCELCGVPRDRGRYRAPTRRLRALRTTWGGIEALAEEGADDVITPAIESAVLDYGEAVAQRKLLQHEAKLVALEEGKELELERVQVAEQVEELAAQRGRLRARLRGAVRAQEYQRASEARRQLDANAEAVCLVGRGLELTPAQVQGLVEVETRVQLEAQEAEAGREGQEGQEGEGGQGQGETRVLHV